MSAPLVVFRTNAGSAIGLGHLRRCLTLAQAVQDLGVQCRFIVNRDRTVAAILRNSKVLAREVSDDDVPDLRETSDILDEWKAFACVIDSYEIPGESMERLRGLRTAVLDDLADRYLPVELVVNGVPGAATMPYRTAHWTKLLLGPKYLLLRDEFTGAPHHPIKTCVERVLITVGGMDPRLLTPKLVRWVRESLPAAGLDVVVGPYFHRETIAETNALAAADSMITVWNEPPAMHELMGRADLAVAGGGQTTYELAASGTPVVAIKLADNQINNLRGLSTAGVLNWISDADDTDLHSKLRSTVSKLAGDPSARDAMSRAGRALVDGLGASRVARALLDICRN